MQAALSNSLCRTPLQYGPGHDSPQRDPVHGTHPLVQWLRQVSEDASCPVKLLVYNSAAVRPRS